MKKIQPRQLFDRWLYGALWKQVVGVVAISAMVYVIATFLLSIINHGIELEDGSTMPEWWMFYYFFADPGNQMSISGGMRVVGLIISTLGSIFLSGLLISTITNVFERRADRWRTGFSYYKLKNHIVIIGSDQMVHGLVNQLCDSTTNQIVVMTSTDAEQMRNALYATLKDKEHRNRIVVNYGQRDSEHYLRAINVVQAKEVYILGDISEFDDIESFHDSLNVQSLTLIAKLCKRAGRKSMPCHVLFDYKTTYHIFQYADLSKDITDYIDFHPFNFYDFWARKVLVAGYSKEENITYKPLDYEPITSRESEKFVHFIIIGMSKMGEALALQAAHIAHFPNYKKRKTKITFIDRNGKVEMGEFKQKCGELFKVSRSTFIDADAWSEAEEGGGGKNAVITDERFITRYGITDEYKHLVDESDKDKEFIDVEWEFIKGDDHNPVVQRLLNQYVADENAIITVAVCLNLTHVSLRSAMHLPKAYYEKNIPILVQQRKTASMVTTLNGKAFDENKRDTLLYKNITPFGMVYDCYDLHLASSVEVCKRIDAVYGYYFTYHTIPTSIDPAAANEEWKNKTITKRWSNIFAAASIPTKLRCIGVDWDINNPCHLGDLTVAQVDMLAEIEHNRWNIEELLLGYRPVKLDEDKAIDSDKTMKSKFKKRFIHYDIRPFNTLKTDEKGNVASVYDRVIVESLPLILNYNNHSYEDGK
ncbi:MAG: hypothetical protein IKD24_02810 [Alistipes sp.]|nr:hypothetical protein [Alistipes sp.]